MTDKEKIRAEIERRMFEDYNGPDAEQNETAQGVCAGLLAFLDTLPDGPKNKDIREIVQLYIDKGVRCMDECIKGEEGFYTFWDGFHNCAVNIMRELEADEPKADDLGKETHRKPAEWSEAQPVEGLDKARFLEVLDRWEEHAIRGMRNGATAYHQGKIALITDLRDWINGED